MEQFSISFRLGKPSAQHGANLAHNNREFSAANIDPMRSSQNIYFTAESIETAYDKMFAEALDAYNAKQNRPSRRIDDYYAHILNGKREEPFYEVIVQFGDSKNASCNSPRGLLAKEMLIEYMNDFQKRNPNLRIFNAVLHMDEASPHLHIDFIPFYTKGRRNGLSTGVSMRAALSEMGFGAKNKYNSAVVGWEQSERMAMEEIVMRHGCLREDKHAHYEHMTVEEYKRSQDAKQMTELLRQSHKIEPTSVAEILKLQLAEQSAKTKVLEHERNSPYRSFYYSNAEKQAFVQAQLTLRNIPFRETENGFEAQQCFLDEIRKIEKSYQAPSTSIRGRMREDVDQCIMRSWSFEEFLEYLQKEKYEIRQGKYLAVRPPFGENFIRLKSLGESYSENALKSRIQINIRFEQHLTEKIAEAKQRNNLNIVTQQTALQYVNAVRIGTLRMKRKDSSKPLSWKNDPELDALLLLNRKIHEGATLASIRTDFENKEQTVASLREQLEQSQRDLKTFTVLQEKCEIVFNGYHSPNFTLQQAKKSMKYHPLIHADNWERVYLLVAQEKQAYEDLQKQLAVAERELKAAADLVGTAERVFGKTFVQDIIDRDGYQKAAKYLPNGAFTPNGQFLG